MNSAESRFLRIRRLSEEDIASIHDAERKADIAWRETVIGSGNRGPGWRVAGLQKLATIELNLPPFWDARRPEEERVRTAKMFFAATPVRKAFVMLDDMGKTEVEAQHAADWIVWKQGPDLGV
jgi:hypothetical protein